MEDLPALVTLVPSITKWWQPEGMLLLAGDARGEDPSS